MNTKLPATMRFISRIDSHQTHCWTLRLYHGGRYILHETFSDSLYHGKTRALKAAKATRSRLIKKFNITPRIRHLTHTRNSHNRSGVIWVNIGSTLNKSGRYSIAWVASFQIKIGHSTREKKYSFAINKYGYETAFQLAVMARYRGINQPAPMNIKPPKKPENLY